MTARIAPVQQPSLRAMALIHENEQVPFLL